MYCFKIHSVRAVLAAVLFFCIPGLSQAQESTKKFHAGLELLGSTTGGVGLNVGCNPVEALDMGLGAMVFPGFLGEVHGCLRWNLLDFPVTPFVQGSLSYFPQVGGEGDFPPWFLRVHGGVKWQTHWDLFLGANLSYQIFGASNIGTTLIGGFLSPAVFLGWNF